MAIATGNFGNELKAELLRMLNDPSYEVVTYSSSVSIELSGLKCIDFNMRIYKLPEPKRKDRKMIKKKEVNVQEIKRLFRFD